MEGEDGRSCTTEDVLLKVMLEISEALWESRLGITVSGSVDFENCPVEYSQFCFFLPLVLDVLSFAGEPLFEKLSRWIQNECHSPAYTTSLHGGENAGLWFPHTWHNYSKNLLWEVFFSSFYH